MYVNSLHFTLFQSILLFEVEMGKGERERILVLLTFGLFCILFDYTNNMGYVFFVDY